MNPVGFGVRREPLDCSHGKVAMNWARDRVGPSVQTEWKRYN